MKVISIANQKGGVLKTTTTINLGACLAYKGYRVLLIDLDSQCNLTQGVIGDIGDDENIYEILVQERKINGIIRDTSIDNLKIIPAGESLVDAEIALTNMPTREALLENALDTPAIKKFDYVLIDNKPSIGLLLLNSLTASDFVLIPVSCEYFPMIGLKYMLKTIRKIQENKRLNPTLRILGFIFTMYDKRESITRQVEEILRERFGDSIFKNVIRINTKAKAAPGKQQNIFEYEELKGRGTEDYKNLMVEFLERINNNAEEKTT